MALHEIGADEHGLMSAEARIARELRRLAEVTPAVGCPARPHPYVRRHLAEHAAAGRVLDDLTLPPAFLPYADAVRLRAAASTLSTDGSTEPLALLPVIRHVTHEWSWLQPAHNAVAITLRSAMAGAPIGFGVGGLWQVHWATRPAGASEILGRHSGYAKALAAGTLPDGRPVAVTSGGHRNRALCVWDLTAGRPIGDPVVGHGKEITRVAVSSLPDGRVLAITGSYDKSARLWDLSAGVQLGPRLSGHRDSVLSVALAVLPDGTPIAVTGGASGDKTIRLWDTATGEPLPGGPLTGHSGQVRDLAVAHLDDGRVLAVSVGGFGDPDIHLWELPAGTHRVTVRAYERGVGTVATGRLPGGRIVAATCGSQDSSIRIWELPGMTPAGELPLRSGAVVQAVSLGALPDGAAVVLAGTANDRVHVWRLGSGVTSNERTLTGHSREVFAVANATMADGRAVAVTTSADTTIRVWDVAGAFDDGVAPAGTHTGVVTAASTITLADGRDVAVICGGFGGTTLQVWNLGAAASRGAGIAPEQELFWTMVSPRQHDRELKANSSLARHVKDVGVLDTVRSSGGIPYAVTGSTDGSVASWSVGSARNLVLRARHDGAVRAVAAAELPDGRLIAISAGDEQSLQIWDLTTGELIHEPIEVPDVVGALGIAALPDGRVLAVSGDGRKEGVVRLVDLATGRIDDHGLAGHRGGIRAVATAILPGGRAIAVTGSYDNTARVWDLAERRQIGQPLVGHQDAITATAVVSLADGRTVAVTGSEDRTVRFWDLGTNTSLARPLLGFVPAAIAVHDGPRPWLVIGGYDSLVVAELEVPGGTRLDHG